MGTLFGPHDQTLIRIHDQLQQLVVACPSVEHLATFVETVFWASLELNEGRVTRVCVALALGNKQFDGVSFIGPVPCDVMQIARLAPATPLGGCLKVRFEAGQFVIVGFERSRPDPFDGTVVLDVWEPGVVRVGVGPYPVFAVINGRMNAVLEGRSTNFPRYVQRLLAKSGSENDVLESKAWWRECRAIADLARVIVSSGHGGIVLIVPEAHGPWEDSLRPFAYRFSEPDTTIRDMIRLQLVKERDKAQTMQKLFTEESADGVEAGLRSALEPLPANVCESVRAVAALSGADGAIVLTRNLEVLGFGAKISLQSTSLPEHAFFCSGPADESGYTAPFDSIGGTRHQSSARFVEAHPETIALVVSQDRHMSVIYWDNEARGLSVLRNAEWWV